MYIIPTRKEEEYMNYQNRLNEQLNEQIQEEMEHSKAYQLFMKQKDSNDYAIKREGYRDDLLHTIYPEERKDVESIIVALFNKQDIDVLKFMADLTTVDGILIVEDQYESLSKQIIDMPNLARYLYIHTKKQMYLKDIKDYCFGDKCQQRVEAVRILSILTMDLELEEIPQLYDISQTIILKENEGELLFWARAIRRKCLKRLGNIGDNEHKVTMEISEEVD